MRLSVPAGAGAGLARRRTARRNRGGAGLSVGGVERGSRLAPVAVDGAATRRGGAVGTDVNAVGDQPVAQRRRGAAPDRAVRGGVGVARRSRDGGGAWAVAELPD